MELRNLLRDYPARQRLMRIVGRLKPVLNTIADHRGKQSIPLQGMLLESIKALVCGASNIQSIEIIVNGSSFFQTKFSDSLIGEIVDSIDPSQLLNVLEATRDKHNTPCLQDGKPLKMLHCDGTGELAHFFSFAASSGLYTRIEHITECGNIGNELSATTAIVDKLINNFDIVTLDGKYYSMDLFTLIKQDHSRDFFIRIKGDDERKFYLLEKFRELRDNSLSIVTLTDTDEARCVSYSVTYCTIKTNNFPVIVGQIQRSHIKDNITTSEYFITSLPTEMALYFHEISVRHWEVETIFKQLKEQLISTHCYKKSRNGAYNLMLLFTIAMNILSVLLLELAKLDVTTRRVGLDLLRKFLLIRVSCCRCRCCYASSSP